MKFGFFTFLCILSFSLGSYGFSYRPCSEEQKSAAESLSFVPGMVVAFHVATVAASQVLWVASTSRDKGGDPKSHDGDTTLYWLLPSLSFDFAALTAYPGCGSIVQKDGQISKVETEHQIKINTRIASVISLMGQFFSLTNTVDEDKRLVTRTLMGTTVVSQILFEWLWTFQSSQPVVMIKPYLNQDSRGLQVVYSF
jgi:hypothetical protein